MLPVIVLPMTVSVLKLAMPPPLPLLFPVLPVIVQFVTVSVPWFSMPPPFTAALPLAIVRFTSDTVTPALTVKTRERLPPLIVRRPPPSSVVFCVKVFSLVVMTVGTEQPKVTLPPAVTAASSPAGVQGYDVACACCGASPAIAASSKVARVNAMMSRCMGRDMFMRFSPLLCE